MNTMIRTLWHLAALGLLAMLLVGCGGGKSNAVLLSETDNGGQLTIKSGQTINVRLEANPTTGFGWEVSQVDAQILAQKGEKAYEAASQSKPVVGGGGWEIFSFAGMRKGETTLQMIYHRAWEKDVPPSKTYQITVTVE